MYSNGKNFTSETLPTEFKDSLDPTIPNVLNSTSTNVLVTDLNNDGKSDIVFAVNSTIYLFISNGDSLKLQNTINVDSCGWSSGNFLNSKIVGNQQELIFAVIDCKFNEKYKEIDFASNLDNPLYVDTITDGNKIQSTVIYNTEYPSPSATVNFPVFPIKRSFLPKMIVSKDLNTGAIISEQVDSFTNGYNHTTGKGFLGFQRYSVEDIINDNTVQTTNYNFTIADSLGHTSYYTWPYSQTTTINSDTFVSQTNYMRAKGGNAAIKLFLPVTTTSITSEPIKGNYSITDSVKTFNLALGRVTDRISIASDGGTTPDNNWKKETKLSYNTISGYENVPGTIVSTSTLGTDTHTETTNYTYSSSFPFRRISKRYQGEITDTFNNFDSYGNVTSETLKVIDGTPSRTVSCSYDSYGRFVTGSTDVTGNKSVATYRAIDGAPLSKTDPNGLSEIYNYSLGGNSDVIQITLPDGNVISDSTAWDLSGTALIRHSKGITNGNSVTDYINGIGQKLKETTYGFKKKLLNTSYTYNVDNTIHTETDNAGNVTLYLYNYPDASCRLHNVLNTNLNINLQYTYGQNPYTVTTTDNISGQTKTDTIDVLGNVTGISATTQNIHNSYYASGKLKSMTNGADGSVISMTYDPLLLTQLSLTDPDAGIKRYKYNGFGQITKQADTLKSDTIIYDPFGRIQTSTQKDNNGNTNKTTYTYSNTHGTLELVQSIKRDSVSETYSYDPLCRPISVTTSGPVTPGKAVTGTKFTTSMTYNTQGQVASTTYPTGLTVTYNYDPVGNLSIISNATFGNIWTGDSVNALNQWVKYVMGNKLITTKSYSTSYQLTGISTGTSSNPTGIQNLSFNFNPAGQLTQRGDKNIPINEGFNYDPLDRLTTDSIIGTSIKHITSYTTNPNNNGNISSTTWGGKYTYDPKHIHAVDIISGVSPYKAKTTLSDTITQCTYNADNQILTINNGIFADTFTYGANGERFRVDMSKSGNMVMQKVYVNNSEFGYLPSGTNMYQRTIIYAPTGVCAIFQDTVGNPSNLYYIHTDYLGSWLTITNSAGVITNSYSYDAWGRPRNPKTWHADSIPVNSAFTSLNSWQPRFDYGYTGQEQMAGFGLINYNARIYDPYSQRFMNPDPDVQDPSNAQNLNRYSYCLNNPLRYTDPSGNIYVNGPNFYNDPPPTALINVTHNAIYNTIEVNKSTGESTTTNGNGLDHTQYVSIVDENGLQCGPTVTIQGNTVNIRITGGIATVWGDPQQTGDAEHFQMNFNTFTFDCSGPNVAVSNSTIGDNSGSNQNFDSGAHSSISEYNPGFCQKWAMSDNVFAQFSYGLVNDICVGAQTMFRGPDTRNLDGSRATASQRQSGLLMTAAAAVIPVGKFTEEGAATVGDLIKLNGGKNSVTIENATQKIRYDLAGKAHGGVPTPHMQIYKKNFVDGVLKSLSRDSKKAIPMMQQDLEFVKKFLMGL
jgi:RHS repeat-associated protein